MPNSDHYPNSNGLWSLHILSLTYGESSALTLSPAVNDLLCLILLVEETKKFFLNRHEIHKQLEPAFTAWIGANRDCVH